MKKNKLMVSLLAVGMLATLPATAEDVVKITTSKQAGETLTLQINQSASVTVDWGDGTNVDVASTSDNLLTITGEVKGKEITLHTIGKLTTLVCAGQEVTALDLSGATNLLSLYCQNNSLSTLSVTNCTKLLDLNCSNNGLTQLDATASKNGKLQTLNAANNQLSSVDALKGSALNYVDVSNNEFTTLNLTSSSDIDVLKCNDNNIKSMFAGTSPYSVVACGGNGLTSLVLSNTSNLTQLFAEGNSLSSLNLNTASNLTYLAVENNKLTSIKYPQGKVLRNITCENNNLSLATLPSRSYVNNIVYAPQNSPAIDIASLMQYQSVNREKHYYLLCTTSSSQSKVSPYALDVTNLMLDYEGVKANTYTVMKVTDENPEGEEVSSRELYNTRKNGLISFKSPVSEVFVQFTSDNYPEIVQTTTPHFVVVNSVGDITAINNATIGTNSLEITANNGTLTLTSGEAKAVKVYNANGQQVWIGIVDGMQSVKLTKGVYVVNGQKVVL